MKTPKYKGSFLKPTQQKHADKVFDFLKSTTKEPDWRSVADKLAEALEDLLAQQNDAPLERYRKEWEEYVAKGNYTLNEYKKLKQ